MAFGLLAGFVPMDTDWPQMSFVRSDSEPDAFMLAAFEVLTAKCNVCHVKQNPRKVFTLDNMNPLAPRIYKQVFVKKRMPRGKQIKLTPAEYNTLEKWISRQSQ